MPKISSPLRRTCRVADVYKRQLFGIEPNVAMQVVAVGFVIGVLQDSAETALNSSTDVVFTAAASEHHRRKSQSHA